jgi:hypothetical protein
MNPININSSNIGTFGFTTVFKLYDKKISFDLTGLTTFIGSGLTNVQGVCFKITDPVGITLLDIDFTNPAIVPADGLTLDVDIPSQQYTFGRWNITGVIRDSDGHDYSIPLQKNICPPVGLTDKGYVNGIMDADVNCYSPSIKIGEQTPFNYLSKQPASFSKSGNLFYPQGTISDVAFEFTPFVVDVLYTGDYLVKNISTARYDLEGSVFVEIKYFTNLKFSVDCQSSLSSMLCCIYDAKQIYDKAPKSERGIDAKDKLDRAAIPLNVALVKEKLGQDASKEVSEIKQILDCDCNCIPVLLEPTRITPGGDGSSIAIVQAGGVTVSSSTAGSVTQYTISSKIVQFTKQDVNDVNFSITRVDSQYGTVYSIGFDYDALALTILTHIQDSEELTALLKLIIGSVGSGVDLSGITSNCIVTITNCNYLLVEQIPAGKTVTSIKIAGAVYAAPSTLLLTNATGIAAWLNGLSLGTFTVNLDADSTSVSIVSNANPNVITDLVLQIGSGYVTRQFNRACITLSGILTQIMDYICALDATQVLFGLSGKNICSFDSTGAVVTTAIDPTVPVSDLLSTVIAQQCALFNKITSVVVGCEMYKSSFLPSTATVISTDGLFGLKNDSCARFYFPDIAKIILSAISGDSTLSAQFCAIVATCTAPACTSPTNVSGVFTAGATCAPVTNMTGSVS